jgi:hypothetical protein
MIYDIRLPFFTRSPILYYCIRTYVLDLISSSWLQDLLATLNSEEAGGLLLSRLERLHVGRCEIMGINRRNTEEAARHRQARHEGLKAVAIAPALALILALVMVLVSVVILVL